ASFSDSPVPTPRTIRPGYRHPSVANAWAITAGWYRNVGVSTEVPSTIRSGRAPTDPSHGNDAAACPPSCRQGWTWSERNADSNPACSANATKSASSCGPNCSEDALYPILSNVHSFVCGYRVVLNG